MTNGKFTAVCIYCRKRGNSISGTFKGEFPGNKAQISGKCFAHPGGSNMPHVAVWVKN